MANKLGNLLMIGGVAVAALTNCLYVVDPGEKALIMNQISGLKKTVYNQGYNFKIPFVEVHLNLRSPQSSTTRDSSPSIFMSPQVPKISRPLPSLSEFCSNPFLRSFRTSISCSAEITRRRSSTQSVSKFWGRWWLSVIIDWLQTTPINFSNPERPLADRSEQTYSKELNNSTSR